MNDNPVQHPLPAGVYADFTYACNDCGGTVSVVSSMRQPHTCKALIVARALCGDEEPCNDHWNDGRRVAAALAAAGFGPLAGELSTEWGVRRDQDSAIYSEAAARETVQRQRKRKMKSFLIKRQVGPWELAEP